MRPVLRRDLPRGAAATVVALVLAATIVTGRESAPVSEAPRPAAQPSAAAESADELDIDALVRGHREQAARDLFLRHSWVPESPIPERAVPPPAPPRPPEPPALPYKYVGRMVKQGKTLVYLLRQEELLVVEPGSDLGNGYRVEAVSEAQVSFVYLPLGVTQTAMLVSAP